MLNYMYTKAPHGSRSLHNYVKEKLATDTNPTSYTFGFSEGCRTVIDHIFVS